MNIGLLRKRFAFNIFTMDGVRTAKDNYLNNFTYSGPDISVSEAKEVLSQFSYNTGSVDLNMDVKCGVARVCLNNPRIKNAINGNMNCLFVVKKNK